MAKPEQQLLKLLAESNIRIGDIRIRHDRTLSSLPARQQAIQEEIDQLRQQIQSKGLGKDQQAEARYMDLLQQLRYLGQSYDLQPDRPSDQPDPDLQKAIAYGRLLLDVYQGSDLHKAASGAHADILAAGMRLAGTGNGEAEAIARELMRLA